MAPMRLHILGVPVDAVDLEEAAATVEGFCDRGGPHLVLTPNPEMVMRAQRHGALREALARADLNLADGVGVVWAARLLGLPLRRRVTGADLVVRLLSQGAGRRRFYFLGARPGVAEEAARRARARHPGLEVCGTHHGYFSPHEEPRVVEGIRRASPHILVVGMGSPRQEEFLLRHLEELRVPVAVAVGGTLDVLAGSARRAPALLRRLGLEWLWRLAGDPRRWRRGLALPRFAGAVLREAWARRRGG
ncbi:MAG: WecB/TagA/CpsF family glycosyltransferase [Acetobacteraceae bacterium]|nr:WecB/TagA/CpsF family glycosyltransferase [Acetobacteraceae bacterium]